MLIDLSCPVELHDIELSWDDAQRVQCYITLTNLSNSSIRAIWADLLIKDGDGKTFSTIPLELTRLELPSRTRTTETIAVDDAPEGCTADVRFSRVVFSTNDEWQADPGKLRDCAVPEVTAEELRMLQTIISDDAICFPEERGDVWICVCGRHNLIDSEVCVRCGRYLEDELNHMTRERIYERYEIFQKDLEEQQRYEERMRELQKQRDEEAKQRQAAKKLRRKKALGIIVPVLIITLALLGGYLALKAAAPQPIRDIDKLVELR